MLDIKFIVAHPEETRRGIGNRGYDVSAVDRVMEIYRERNDRIFRADNLKKERNQLSKQVAALKKEKKDAQEIIERTRQISREIGDLDKEIREIGAGLDEEMLQLPNLPLPEVPVGDDPKEHNRVLRTEGERPKFSFPPKAHWDLGESLDILDFERGGRLAGASFVLLKGWGARLQRALINFMMDLHVDEHGYREIWPPFLSRRECMVGTGQIPALEADMYRVEQDDLFLVPTGEVPVTNIHREEILKETSLPLRYVAYTPCFRREAGSYGKDTRGLMRVHQFEKVELVRICRPEDSEGEHEALLQDAEKVLRLLGLEYRVLLLCTTDMGFAGAKCYDLEIWSPALERYLEISSVTTYRDFQARRAGIRYRDGDGKVRHVHTLNGSGLALARLLLCLLEAYQREDGSVAIPEVLRPYMGGASVID